MIATLLIVLAALAIAVIGSAALEPHA